MRWPIVALGDLFEIARGGSPRPIEDYVTDDPDGLNWVSISDATRSSKVIERTERRIRKEGLAKSRWVEPGDFLLSNSMSFGRPYIMGTTGCIHDGWLVLKPGRTPVDTSYLYYLLGSEPVFAQFAKRATGTTVRNLNTRIVGETKIPLPPLTEQRRIAAILDQADGLRRLRRQSLSRLVELGQAIFHEMFGDLANSALPKKLGELTTKIGSGATPKGGNSSYKDSGTPFIRSMNVHDCQFKPQGLAFISNDQARKLNNVELLGGDILVNITGASVGRVCALPESYAGGRVNQHVSIVRPGAQLLTQYLEAFLTFPSTKAKLLRVAGSGATREAITKAQLQNLDVPAPELKRQQLFVDAISAKMKKQRSIEDHANQLDSLFASLQHRAFRGEL